MIRAFRFRIKNPNQILLRNMALSVNFVWNYCNDTSVQYLDKYNKWLSGFDLCYLTSGCSKDLQINAQTVQAIAQEFATRRGQFKKRKLSWRSKNRSLGWIPFNGQTIRVKNDTITYNQKSFRFWKSRQIEGKIKTGSFTQDAQGKWYVSFICDVEKVPTIKTGGVIGIDLGLKTIATLSDGTIIDRDNFTNKYAKKLATAQRARKKKRVTAIYAKIKNSRKDWNHKTTTKLVNNNDGIFVGNVNSGRLMKTKMAKSVSDAGWYAFKSMLAYKAIALGVEYKEVNESFSTVTCSTCFERSGPSGLSALGVREWTCKCGTAHNRDVNAAMNILRLGRQSLIKGSSLAFA